MPLFSAAIFETLGGDVEVSKELGPLSMRRWRTWGLGLGVMVQFGKFGSVRSGTDYDMILWRSSSTEHELVYSGCLGKNAVE